LDNKLALSELYNGVGTEDSVDRISQFTRDKVIVRRALFTHTFAFLHTVTVFVKENRETGKVVQKPCLFTRQSRSVQLDSRSVCDFVAR